MNKKYILLFLLLNHFLSFGQLGFCNGSSGTPIFFENFGSGTTYGPALPAGYTNYTYVNSGFPQDGQYTLFYRTNIIPNSQNWLYSLDHTPDNEPNGTDGKCLIVNASNVAGEFYKRTVTGLCSNTRFEFSAWVLNILNPATGACPGTGIPVNVTFEIWDATDTTLLQSGNTGNINGTTTPIWNQYGLVFTMPVGQTSVILKMKNNGSGGCGNDLAIDDIMFRACGEFSEITNAPNTQDFISICENETITNNILQVITTGTGSNVYQWQQSNDNINYTDIAGETTNSYSIPTLTNTTYYRVKVANDIANLNNPYCSTLSEIFTVLLNPLPNAPISNGDQTLCSNYATIISATANSNENINWYDAASNGNLIQSNSSIYSTTIAGTYYAESYNLSTGCISSTRTPITVLPLTTVSSSGTTTICSTETTAITLSASDTNAVINWTATSTDVTGFSDGTGNSISQTLTYNGNTSGTVTYTVIPVVNGCEGMAETIVVTVNPQANITPTFNAIQTTFCLNATPPILPAFSSNSTPINGTWSPASINTTSLGTTTYTFIPQSNACINYTPFTLNITITNNIMPDFDATIALCSGSNPPSLNTTSPNGISGTWSPSVINNTVSGSYTFTPNPNQCAVPQTINVTVFEPTLTSIEYTTTGAFTENQIVTVLAFDSGNYLYQLDNGNFQTDNVFTNVSSGSHTITVMDQNGCSPSLTKDLVIINYPHFFTPNGDGFNDYWIITGLNNLQNPSVRVFDRYGKLLKQLPKNTGWDGTYNGYTLPADDYWFTIDFEENNIPKTFRAHFSLSR
jgi:gliding motility-associated-like protein